MIGYNYNYKYIIMLQILAVWHLGSQKKFRKVLMLHIFLHLDIMNVNQSR